MKEENKMYSKPAYKCAICGKIYDNVQDRINCEMACLKKQKEEEKAAAEAKKKAERDEEEREIQADWKARGQEVMDAFTNLFRNNLYKDMFVTASANSSEMTVVVNDYWHHCSKDIKKDFIKSVVVSWCGMQNVRGMKTSDIERWHFTFVHNISGRTLATYDNVWGPSLND